MKHQKSHPPWWTATAVVWRLVLTTNAIYGLMGNDLMHLDTLWIIFLHQLLKLPPIIASLFAIFDAMDKIGRNTNRN